MKKNIEHFNETNTKLEMEYGWRLFVYYKRNNQIMFERSYAVYHPLQAKIMIQALLEQNHRRGNDTVKIVSTVQVYDCLRERWCNWHSDGKFSDDLSFDELCNMTFLINNGDLIEPLCLDPKQPIFSQLEDKWQHRVYTWINPHYGEQVLTETYPVMDAIQGKILLHMLSDLNTCFEYKGTLFFQGLQVLSSEKTWGNWHTDSYHFIGERTLSQVVEIVQKTKDTL